MTTKQDIRTGIRKAIYRLCELSREDESYHELFHEAVRVAGNYNLTKLTKPELLERAARVKALVEGGK